MARIAPLSSDDLADHAEGLAFVEQVMGFVPNSMPTMARVPGLLPAFQGLAAVVLRNQAIPQQLTHMVAMMSSVGGGCRYCQAHTGHSAERSGVDAAKLEAIWEFETSELFTQAERVALRLAFHSGQVPNAVTDDDFDACQEFYDDEEIAAIVAVCSLFGYLNRWNDTMATELEDSPTGFGQRVLSEQGWGAGKHS